jgi:hypothetical protein
MKTAFHIAVLAALLVLPSPCFAAWDVEIVTKERAKELGLALRATADGPNHVRVELEFKPEGELKRFSRVDLRTGREGKPPETVRLQEDRSKPGRVVVRFTADRSQLDKLTLQVMVPGTLGGAVHQIRVKDFVELKKGR